MEILLILNPFLYIEWNPHKTETLLSNDDLRLSLYLLFVNLSLVFIFFDIVKNDFNLDVDGLLLSVKVNTKLLICKVTWGDEGSSFSIVFLSFFQTNKFSCNSFWKLFSEKIILFFFQGKYKSAIKLTGLVLLILKEPVELSP